MAKETKEYHEAKETKKQAKELVKKIVELTGKSKEEAEETVYGKSETKKESKETSGNLPSDVATQEKKAMTYFEEQPKYLKIIENIQKLRASGKIKYEDM
jgi:bacterioferritin (cytochrome b1)